MSKKNFFTVRGKGPSVFSFEAILNKKVFFFGILKTVLRLGAKIKINLVSDICWLIFFLLKYSVKIKNSLIFLDYLIIELLFD